MGQNHVWDGAGTLKVSWVGIGESILPSSKYFEDTLGQLHACGQLNKPSLNEPS